MTYTIVDNVMNYVNRAIIRELADDDQIKSWAIQAYKTLHIPGTQTVKDVDIFQVVNHKVTLPVECKEILRIRLYQSPINDLTYYLTRSDFWTGDNLLKKTQVTNHQEFYNQTGDTLEWTQSTVLDSTAILLFRNGNYEEDYTVNGNFVTVTNHVDGDNYVLINTAIVYTAPNEDTRIYDNALFSTQSILSSIPQSQEVTLVNGKTSKHALCSTCPPVAIRNGRTLECSFESGSIEVIFTVPFESVDGDILIPEHPEVLWRYMAAYAEEMYLNEKAMESPMGQEGYYKQRLLLQQQANAKQTRVALYNATRDQVAHMNINLDIHYQIQFAKSRMMKVASYLHRGWSQRYSDSTYYLDKYSKIGI